jgi:hypothetical protein
MNFIQMSSKEQNALANKVESAFAKLAAHKDDIIQLRLQFEHLPKGSTIRECATWTEFCDKVLGRNIRSVQYLINGRSPQKQPTTILPESPETDESDESDETDTEPREQSSPSPCLPVRAVPLIRGAQILVGRKCYEVTSDNPSITLGSDSGTYRCTVIVREVA